VPSSLTSTIVGHGLSPYFARVDKRGAFGTVNFFRTPFGELGTFTSVFRRSLFQNLFASSVNVSDEPCSESVFILGFFDSWNLNGIGVVSLRGWSFELLTDVDVVEAADKKELSTFEDCVSTTFDMVG